MVFDLAWRCSAADREEKHDRLRSARQGSLLRQAIALKTPWARGFENRIDGDLLVLRRGLSCGEDAHAVGIEDEGFHFGLGAGGGNLLTIP